MIFDQEWTHREHLIMDFDFEYSLICKEIWQREGEAFVGNPFNQADP